MNSKEQTGRLIVDTLSISRFIIGTYLTLEIARNNISPAMLILFGVGLLTDYLDGAIAKTLNIQSDNGASLDVIADTSLVGSAIVFLLGSHSLHNPNLGIDDINRFIGAATFFYSGGLLLANKHIRSRLQSLLP